MREKREVRNAQKSRSRSKVSKHFLMFFMFLSIVLGRGTQVMSQERQQVDDLSHVDFSNRVLTTDCCPIAKQRLDSIMNNAPIVFEGRVVNRSGYSCLFEIEKVYRGGERLQAGTVEVIVSSLIVSLSSGWHIIFAKAIEGGESSAFDANNSVKLELFHLDDSFDCEGCVPLVSYFAEVAERMYDNRGEVAGYRTPYYSSTLGFRSRTKQEVLNFIGGYGLRPTDVPKADTLKTLSWGEIEKAKEDEEREKWYRENAAPYVSPEKFDSVVRDMKLRHGLLDTTKNKGINKIHKRGNEKFYITLDSIKNTVSSGNRFLDFDVMGRTDNMGNYLPSMEIILYYNADSIYIDSTRLQVTMGNILKRTN